MPKVWLPYAYRQHFLCHLHRWRLRMVLARHSVVVVIRGFRGMRRVKLAVASDVAWRKKVVDMG
jgi:hypothetical protein